MKRILLIFSLIFKVALVFSQVCIALDSPVAPTLTNTNPAAGIKGGSFVIPNQNPGNLANESYNSPGYSVRTGNNFSGSGRTTRNAGNYDNNSGKDDPASPNYTGNRNVSPDNSYTSPDTSAAKPHYEIAVAGAALAFVVLFTVAKTHRKVEEN